MQDGSRSIVSLIRNVDGRELGGLAHHVLHFNSFPFLEFLRCLDLQGLVSIEQFQIEAVVPALCLVEEHYAAVAKLTLRDLCFREVLVQRLLRVTILVVHDAALEHVAGSVVVVLLRVPHVEA